MKIGQNCWQIVLKNCQHGGEWFQKPVKITDYGWYLTSFMFLKVSKFQNKFLKSSFLPNYEQKSTDFCPVVWGQKSWQFLVHIFGETMTSEIHSEIYWPLLCKLQRAWNQSSYSLVFTYNFISFSKCFLEFCSEQLLYQNHISSRNKLVFCLFYLA